MRFFKNTFSKYFVIIFVSVLTLIQLRSCLLNDEIKKNGTNIVVKFTLKDDLPKRTYFYFTYYVNGKKITTANSGIQYSILNSDTETEIIDNLKINHFYLAKYVPKDPDKIIVNPSKEVTDTSAILQAGFLKEDIK
jgi:hypothetical protein